MKYIFPFIALVLAVSAVVLSIRLGNSKLELGQTRQEYMLQSLFPSHKVTIIKSITDIRGLTSIQFTQDGRDWGLDYLTKRELDSLKAIK